MPDVGFPGGCGILVVGHGTTDPVGDGETRRLASAVAAAAGVPVELGFLELCTPTIDDGLARLAARGCREAIAAPLLLFAAGHARRDVPGAIAAASERLGLAVRQAGVLGSHPCLLHLSHRRRREAADDVEAVAFVVRGASDPATPAQAREFLRSTLALDGAEVAAEVGFVAAARPTVDEALDLLAEGPVGGRAARRVLVQPHLLFRGRVEEEVAAAVGRARQRHPGVEWIVAERLGPAACVVRALLDRALAAALGTTPPA